MRRIRFAFLVALLSGSAVSARADDSAAGPQTPEGRWLIAHRYYTPSEITAGVGKVLTDLGHEVEIKNGKLSACDSAKAGVYLLIDFQPNTTPKSVNLTIPGKKNTVLLGIYRLEGKILSIAVATGNKRPDSFTNPRDQVLLVLKRAPKKKAANAASSAAP